MNCAAYSHFCAFSLTSQYRTNSHSHSPTFHTTATSTLTFSPSRNSLNSFPFKIIDKIPPSCLYRKPVKSYQYRFRVFNSNGCSLILDDLLSILEALCLSLLGILSIGLALNLLLPKLFKFVDGSLTNKLLFLHGFLLVSAVGVGVLIRMRQRRRICRDEFQFRNLRLNLVERIEKLEEDLRSSVAIVRVLSRQLEKLGIRFRVTRKILKEPVSEIAALAQKTSEATRALVAQQAILQKELGETQKVLLAMQDQQQKQLDLILAIAKATKLGEKKPENIKQQDPPSERVNSVKLQMEQHTQAGLDSVGPQVEDTALKLESL